MATTKEEQEIRARMAKRDMTLARAHGEVLICGTREGTVALRATKGPAASCYWYEAVAQTIQPRVIAEGRASDVLEKVAALYGVVFTPEEREAERAEWDADDERRKASRR
jgi:hypothetical protein